MKNKLINYLLNSNLNTNYTDLYFNEVELLLPLDKHLNSKGLPLYRDYSPKQFQIRYTRGTSNNSNIIFVDNFLGINNELGESNNTNKPLINKSGNIDVKSYLYFPNKENRSLRLTDINSLRFESFCKSTHLEVFLNGNTPIVLNDEFTIEFSFYAEDVNIPWKYQTIFSQGNIYNISLNLATSSTPIKNYVYLTQNKGYGCFLKDNSLVFFDSNEEHVIIEEVNELTWYHICICREKQGSNLILKFYVNFKLVNTVENSINFTDLFDNDYLTTNYLKEDSIRNRFNIGSTSKWTQSLVFVQANSNINQADMSFTGGISNFRLTNNICRYKQFIYSTTLPFYKTDLANKLDTNYNKVVFNYPLNLDCFDYSNNNLHLIPYSKANLKTPNQLLGYYYLDTSNNISSKTLTINNSNSSALLDNTEWCIEFFLTYFLNGNHFIGTDNFYSPSTHTLSSPIYKSFTDFLGDYGFYSINSNVDGVILDETLNILNLTDNLNKKLFRLNLRFLYEFYSIGAFSSVSNIGYYLSLNVSQNGTNWLEHPDFTNNYWIDSSSITERLQLPKEDIILYKQTRDENNDLVIRSAYDDIQTHIAIQKYNDVVYVLYDGKIINSIPFNYNIHSTISNLIVQLNTLRFEEIALLKDQVSYRLGFGIKGLKWTNKAVYRTNNTLTSPNHVNYINSSYPLALNSSSISPPRARILNISREILEPSVSSNTVKWFVFLSQPVDNLVLADFTLTQLDGVTSASLVSITKVNEYAYEIIANTGTGNGKLGLNFIDRKTVRYKGTTNFISNVIGELSFEGEFYNINKNAPIPLLTSGDNAYISTNFKIKISFDAAIKEFNIDKLGLINAAITKLEVLDQEKHIYEITVNPIREDIVIIQAMEGLGVTDSSIESDKSLPITKIFSKAFPILQTPLNNITKLNDLSPSNYTLEELTINNTVYNTSIYPLGETSSSIYIDPNNEISGLKIDEFNPISSESNINADWTIEFYLRINSTLENSSKLSHILSIDNESKGISIFAKEGKFKIQRSTTNSADLFSGLDFKDRSTEDYIEWSDVNFSSRDKYPHFAITKKDNIYRFYINGKRVQLINYTGNVDITKGSLYLGYLANRVTDLPYYLSNVRLTHGKALYTSSVINIPGLPYNVLPDITSITSLLNYISIYSNNSLSNVAKAGDKVILKFSSIINLITTPLVTILDRPALVTRYIDINGVNTNIYLAEITVLSNDIDKQVNFEISITSQSNVSNNTIFNSTTNNTFVIIDNTSLTSSIYTEHPNNTDYIIPAYIEFSEEIQSFTLENITVANCVLSNLRKEFNQNKYTFDITAIISGNITVQLLSNKVQDRAGNYNSASNIFTRNTIIPPYIPDNHWNNVILLIQSEDIISDQSQYDSTVLVNNVDIVTNTSPTSLIKSYEFNTSNSHLRVNLEQSLPSNSLYTIEFYLYSKSNTLIRLNAPNLLPASEITSNSFKLNWELVNEANNYKVDISRSSSFNNYLNNFKEYAVGNTDKFLVTNSKNNNVPILNKTYFKDTQGISTYWSQIFNEGYLGYRIDVSLNEDFTKKLYQYNNKFNINNSITIGSINNLTKVIPINNLETQINSNQSLSNGLLTGLITQNTATSKNKLLYVLEESSVRLYDGSKTYQIPGIIPDIELFTWKHIAITCDSKYNYLYVNGVLEDRIKAVSWSSGNIDIGKDLFSFKGNMQGIRITKGINRYISNFTPPLLPYGQS